MHTPLAVLLFATLSGAGRPPTVAVSYFDNNSANAELAPLGKGLADMLITDLAQVRAIQIVERARLNEALAELQLSRSKFIDPATARKLGRGLAAQYVMTGGYTVSGEMLRIDARIFNVETGAVLVSRRVEGQKEDFFALEKQLVDLLVDTLQVALAPAEKAQLRRNATQSFDAWAGYSAGLDAQDRGNAAQARALFEKALAADPNYRAAKTASERLAAVFASHDRQTEASADEALTGLDPKARDFAQKVEILLTSLNNTKTEQLRRKIALLRSLGERKLLACTQTSGLATGNPTVLVGGVPSGGTVRHCRQAYEVLLLAHRLTGDPSQWEVIPRVCEYFIHQLPGDQALLRYCEMNLLDDIQNNKADGAEAAREKLEEDRQLYSQWKPGTWGRALLDNDDGMKALLGVYAALAPAPSVAPAEPYRPGPGNTKQPRDTRPR